MPRRTKRKRQPIPQPRVIVRKLGRQNAWGLAHLDANLIEIDPRLTGLAKLEVLIHERLHILEWAIPESEVYAAARQIALFLHTHGVRIIESGDSLAT
jgi:hypothetical protein